MSLSLSRILSRHHMAISCQENAEQNAMEARICLFTLIADKFDEEWWKARAIRYQHYSAWDSKFARERMGLED